MSLLRGRWHEINAIALTHGNGLLAGVATGELVLWDVPRAEAIRTFGGNGIGVNPGCVALHPTATFALVCWSTPGGPPVTPAPSSGTSQTKDIRRYEGHASLLRAVAFLPDGDTALAGPRVWGATSSAI